MFRKLITAAVITGTTVATFGAVAGAAQPDREGTTVPGHATDRYDQDGNGIPDEGAFVNGHYTALYAVADNGWYWDLGDGRIQGSVGSVDELDPLTLVTCDYQITYRADFGNDPMMNDGWIINAINCSDGTTYNSLIVSDDDPRYTGNPDNAVWGSWEYVINTQSGAGNLANPMHPANHVG